MVAQARTEVPAQPKATKPVKRVTDRPGNTNGKVLVLEYHHVMEKETRWGRSRENFRKDLERLYKAGFRPVTLIEYLENRMKLPPGASPVVFTFDDGHLNQFHILPDGTVDPNCMVGLWRKFAATRPDFPMKATFFVLPPVPFTKKDTAKKKVELLRKWGSELGIHTMTHRSLAKLSDDEVKKEIAESILWLRKWGVEAKTMAMPYGEYPQNKALLKEFLYKGQRFKLSGAVRVGAVPSTSPTSDKLKRYGLPRIQGVDLEGGLTWWMKPIKDGDVDLYVQP